MGKTTTMSGGGAIITSSKAPNPTEAAAATSTNKTPSKKRAAAAIKTKSIESFFTRGSQDSHTNIIANATKRSSSRSARESPTSVTSTPKTHNNCIDSAAVEGNDSDASATSGTKTKKRRSAIRHDCSDGAVSNDKPPRKMTGVAPAAGNRYPIGTSLCKKFNDDCSANNTSHYYHGKVVGYDTRTKYYSVLYDDDDCEEMTDNELTDCVRNYNWGGGCRRNFWEKSMAGAAAAAVGEKKRKHDSEVDEDSSSIRKTKEGKEDEEEVVEKMMVKKKPRAPTTITKASATTCSNSSNSNKPPPPRNAFEILTGGKTPRRDAKKKINYADHDDDDDDEEKETPMKKSKAKLVKVTTTTNANGRKGRGGGDSKKKKKRNDEEDSDVFLPGSESEDDSFVVDHESEEEKGGKTMVADDDDDDSDDDFIGKKNKKTAAAKKKKMSGGREKKKKEKNQPVAKIKTRKSGGDEDDDDDGADDDDGGGGGDGSIEALCAKKAKDINMALNNPQALPDNGPYVEPVGIDATDGIVEGIIGGMVQKVGKLLLLATKRSTNQREMGELDFPIKLNTACSGTDAPSIALSLVKEYLDRLISNNEDDDDDMDDGEGGHGFDFEHNMSCEIEPFKQAYIGRNFPLVKLFPDITKLTAGKTVTDVYGRAQTIPESE